ncbi:MAG: glycoside hydrolase family 3 C-terminal domain-containing protein [Christensenellaceae bacterium]|jgi:beta-glucosidase|nr:glycoside hydrolase family 3 C-terminal domain-containing protein [Christensenellaceae bacterium]
MLDKDIETLVNKLSIVEKSALCSGVNLWESTPIKRLDIPSIFFSDGPHGLRRELEVSGVGNILKTSIPATCFPTAVTSACSWDTELIKKMGEALGEESLCQGVQVLLGPGVNIKRSPLCGRNFEYFSEDPLLSGELGAAYLIGLQSTGVGGSLKHYCANSQEQNRHISSSEVDERALHEIYLTAFEIATKKANPATIMCCYNLVNGVHGSDSRKLLTDILRQKWGYNGCVVSDWGATNDRVEGIRAGLDIEMPSSNGENDKKIVDAVNSGELDIKQLDLVVKRILTLISKCKSIKDYKTDYDEHHKLAKRIASESFVLLKNENDILPIKQEMQKSIAVIGMLASHMRIQGAGSSQVIPRENKSFTDILTERGVKFDYAEGYKLEVGNVNKKKVGSRAHNKIEEAVEKAANNSLVLLFIGLPEDYEAESFDRSHIKMPPEHEALLDAIYEVNKNIIVILSGGSPVKITHPGKFKALLNVYLGGEAQAEAIFDIIYGNTNPSGKLAETYPVDLSDYLPSQYYGNVLAEYRESIYVGYRYYDAAQKQVRYPFGYGLSYTKFKYSNLRLSANEIKDGDILTVSIDIENTGGRFGKEIVQLYVKDLETTIFRPEKELKGFVKVGLEANEKKTITIDLDKRAFAFYDIKTSDWQVEPGEFQILIGSSSRDIKLYASVNYIGEPLNIDPRVKELASYYNIKQIDSIPDEEFAALLGRSPNVYIPPRKGTFNLNTTVDELEKGNWFGKLFKYVFKKSSISLLSKDASRVQKKMTMKGAGYMPVRNFFMMSSGNVSYKATINVLKAFNGKTITGISKFVIELLKKRKFKKDVYQK